MSQTIATFIRNALLVAALSSVLWLMTGDSTLAMLAGIQYAILLVGFDITSATKDWSDKCPRL